MSQLALGFAYIAAAFLSYCFVRVETPRVGRSQALTLAWLIFIQIHIAIFLHYYLVDHEALWGFPTNTTWQQNLQNNVIRLSPDVLPHSYRFLPNVIVRWMEMGHVRFDVARDIYRMLAGLLLFYAIYRYARLYTGYMGGMLAVLLAGLVYPVSFTGYAGQLTDPLSHLSFVLACIFIETEDFPLLLTTLLIGSLAKETVLGMIGFYVLFCFRQKGYRWKAPALCAASLAMYFAVRLFVLHGSMGYKQVSNVTLSHVAANWFAPVWPQHAIITVLSLVPFLVLGWKSTPPSLKQMVFYLFPVLFVSSLFFSWLNETRNFMPLVFVLAVIGGRYLASLQPEVSTTPKPCVSITPEVESRTLASGRH